ncbi:sulfite exporter TauE/SafE family protein [Actinoplanes sp. CA-054009]
MKRTLLIAALCAVAFAALPSAPAAAHPLGNFSVNRYAGLTLHPDRIDAVAVADLAELPTLQDPPATCDEAAQALTVTVAGAPVRWSTTESSLTYAKGAGGLPTSRLTCRLTAQVSLGAATRIEVANRFRDDRIGWRELSAAGVGIHLSGSSLPTTSPSNELRDYPSDLLSSPSDVRSAAFTAEPGASSATEPTASPVAGGAPSFLTAAERRLEALIGNRMTPLVGFLAVLLSLVLGAAHAALPGHGKTVMAAYLAGSRGRPRDAVLVGATVTFTHTAGVLALGLLLTTASGIAGETVLSWLGLSSGILVMAVGLATLIPAIRRRTAHHHHHSHSHGAAHSHSHAGSHSHSHDPGRPQSLGHHAEPAESHHGHGLALADRPAHEHSHSHDHRPGKWSIAGLGVAGGLVPSPSALIVLLGAAALGRTIFGVLLVIAYGLGMAATLTAAGLLLLRLRDRLERHSRFFTRWRSVAQPLTATLIVLVGLGLAGRALFSLA